MDGSRSDTPASARELFDARVLPLLSVCAGCHIDGTNTHWMGTSLDAAYDTLVANPSYVSSMPDASMLLTKGTHPGAESLYGDPAKLADVKAWLEAEAQQRTLAAAVDVTPYLKAFADCMAPEDWDASGMNQLPLTRATNPDGTCSSCHSTPEGDTPPAPGTVYLNNNSSLTFQQMQLPSHLKKLVAVVLDSDGQTFSKYQMQSVIYTKGSQTGDPLHPVLHSRFKPTDKVGYYETKEQAAASTAPTIQAAVTSFYARTLQRWTDLNGKCQ